MSKLCGGLIHPDWVEEVVNKLNEKMCFGVQKAREGDFIPYSTQNGTWAPTSIQMWTNGFWPASMWQMHRLTGEALYRDEAVRTEEMLDAALKDFKQLHHDVGFMWLIQSGVHYEIDKNQDSYDRTLFAAMTLASRYNPNGFFRAWNGEGREGWAIVDCMMNLPLLYWASRQTGDVRFKLMAMQHADTTIKHFVRADGSCNHIVIFDQETGEFMDNPHGQGYASGSSWSRGQAWALYGFTLSYIMTGKQEYLDTAKKVAHYFIANVQDDWIPDCDFRAPSEPVVKDNAAGSIAACGLLELSCLVPEYEAQMYSQAAGQLLLAMEEKSANWEKNDPAIFTHCTVAYHTQSSRHSTMNYADYYFIEAVAKLRGEKMLFWAPDMERQI